MSIFYPDIILHRVSDIESGLLEEWGVKALVLDVDNTLTTHNNPVPDADVLLWLEKMKALGMMLVILSNNHPERVRPFAQQLGLDFTALAGKPLTGGLRRTARRLGLKPGEMAMVGDQIFTDILAGNLFGARTILVEPMEEERHPGFRVKRRLERPILRGYQRKGGKAGA